MQRYDDELATLDRRGMHRSYVPPPLPVEFGQSRDSIALLKRLVVAIGAGLFNELDERCGIFLVDKKLRQRCALTIKRPEAIGTRVLVHHKQAGHIERAATCHRILKVFEVTTLLRFRVGENGDALVRPAWQHIR